MSLDEFTGGDIIEAKELATKVNPEHLSALLTGIEALKEQLVDRVKSYCREQKELWQRIPYLALHLDGRAGFNEHYHRTYSTGYWMVFSSDAQGDRTIHVDCATGELTHSYHGELQDPQVLRVAASIHKIDAQKIIDELTEMIEYSDASPKESDYQKNMWEHGVEHRKKMMEQYNVQEVYTR